MDPGLATNDWLLKFLGTKIHHLLSDSLDHYPLWIVPDGLDVIVSTKPFRFEEMWLSNLGYSRVVEAVWSSNDMVDPSTKVMRKVEKCGKELKRWNRDHFGNVRKELAKKKKTPSGCGEGSKEKWLEPSGEGVEKGDHWAHR